MWILTHGSVPVLELRIHRFCLLQGDSTPTAVFDVDASYPWNPRGDGLMMESLDFPVALVVGGSVDRVRARAVSNGNVGELFEGSNGNIGELFRVWKGNTGVPFGRSNGKRGGALRTVV